MKHPLPALVVTTLLAACVSVADAQPRRAPPRRPRTTAPAPPPTPAPTPAPTAPDGPLDTRHVVQRAQGTWLARCVASRGCVAPRALPPCAPTPSGPNLRVARPLTFAEVVDQRLRLAGQQVSVRARLEAGAGCTEVGCGGSQGTRACCNHCQGAVSLTGRADSSMRVIGLGVEGDPAFACRGDDSGVCCGTEVPAGDVVVTGTLRLVPNSGGAYRIESPTLCRATD